MASSAHSEDSSSSIFTSSATDKARCLGHAWSQAYAVLCLQKNSRARDFSLWQRGHFSRCLANLSVTALLAAAAGGVARTAAGAAAGAAASAATVCIYYVIIGGRFAPPYMYMMKYIQQQKKQQLSQQLQQLSNQALPMPDWPDNQA